MRKWIAAFLTIPVTIIMATLAILAVIISRRKLPTLVMQSWAKMLMAFYGVRIKVRGIENVDIKKPSIYMPNHASMVDIPVLIAALPVDLRFIFKHTILYIPFLGQAIYFMGMVPINRTNSTKAAESLRKAGRQIRNGSHILIFPEGTRTRSGQLLTFKKGGFYLAIQESIDIIPISINHSQAIGGRESLMVNSGEITLDIHERINTEPYTIEMRHDLISRVRHTIESGLVEPYAKTPPTS